MVSYTNYPFKTHCRLCGKRLTYINETSTCAECQSKGNYTTTNNYELNYNIETNKLIRVLIPVIRGESIEEQINKLVEGYKEIFIIHEVKRITNRPRDGFVEFEVYFTNK